MTDAILKFQDENRNHLFLSNFYPSPITQTIYTTDGSKPAQTVTYPTVEHYFQAQKSDDELYRHAVASAKTPGIAKRLGRSADMRPDWEWIKLLVMRSAVNMKFPALNDKWSPNVELSTQLLDTGDAYLVEGNTWGDYYWGAVDGRGQNWLGVLLMARRTQLRYIANKIA